MKIVGCEIIRCDGGWRAFSFLKLTTDEGLVGWAEVIEGFGNAGLNRVIEALARLVIGRDPQRFAEVIAWLRVKTRQAPGGLNHQAVGAIENALLDIAAKALSVPVYALFGGPVRTRIPIYWSHCGTWHINFHAFLGVPRMETYDDLARHAEKVRGMGFDAIKTHIHPMVGGRLGRFDPGFGHTAGSLELNPSAEIMRAAVDTLNALRAGAGDDCALMVDANFNFRTEGFIRLAQAVAPFNLAFLEIDLHDPQSLALIRRDASCPIASCETLCGRAEFKPYFEEYAVDVPIVDAAWNGLAEAVKIAAMAEAYQMNVVPHNYRSHLATMIAAHFAAIVPNLRTMEFDVERVPWIDECFSGVPQREKGEMLLPTGPGWGIEPIEAVMRTHPPRDT